MNCAIIMNPVDNLQKLQETPHSLSLKSKLKLFVLCSCHLLAIVWQRHMMCSNGVGRKM